MRFGSFEQIFQVSELNKVISSTEDAFEESLIVYLKALGNIKGFQKVADYLVYDGIPTLSLESGIKICDLLSKMKVVAPWQIYLEYYQNVMISDEMFEMILRHRIRSNDLERLLKIASYLEKDNSSFRVVFRKTFEELASNDFIDELLKHESVRSICEDTTDPSIDDLDSLCRQILDLKRVNKGEVKKMLSFIKGAAMSEENKYLVYIEGLKNINWFYNWVSFAIKIERLALNAN
jgi:hypothetical protein